MLKNLTINLNSPEDHAIFFELTMGSALDVSFTEPEYVDVVIKGTIPRSPESVTVLAGRVRERARQIILDLAAALEE